MEKFDLDKFLGPYAPYLADDNAMRFRHIIGQLGTSISLLENSLPEHAKQNKNYIRQYLDIMDKNPEIRKKELTTKKDLKISSKSYIDRLEKSVKRK